ncbi:MAG: hypothetical protein JWP95_1894 [Actinotalea sp.]|nr:hypothetical protein [Actinotalea sp.]
MRAVLAVLFGIGHAVTAVAELVVAPALDDGGRLVGWTSVGGVLVCAAVVAVNATASASPERAAGVRPTARLVALVAVVAQVLVVLVAMGAYVRLSDAFPDAVAAALQLLFTTGIAVATWRSARPLGWRRRHL